MDESCVVLPSLFPPPLSLSASNSLRLSAFEAYAVDGEVLDGQTPSVRKTANHHQYQRRKSSNTPGTASAATSAGSARNTGDSGSSQSGSASRAGGRSSFFFGANYAGRIQAADRAEMAAAARLSGGQVDAKAASLLGSAAGSAAEVPTKSAYKIVGVSKGEDGVLDGGSRDAAVVNAEVCRVLCVSICVQARCSVLCFVV